MCVVSPQQKELNTQQNEQSFSKMGKLQDYRTNIIGTGEFHFRIVKKKKEKKDTFLVLKKYTRA